MAECNAIFKNVTAAMLLAALSAGGVISVSPAAGQQPSPGSPQDSNQESNTGQTRLRELNIVRERSPRDKTRAGLATQLVAEAPKVMLGISMAKPSGELAGHLGIKPGAATLVNFVHKQTPAAEAGLEQYDVITGVKLVGGDSNPAGGAAPEKVRELLRDAKPGDEVEMQVLHRGAEKTLKLKLVAFDETKLADGPVPENLPGDISVFGLGGSRGEGETMRFSGPGLGGVVRRGERNRLMPMPGEPGVPPVPGVAPVPAIPPVPPAPFDFNDQQAWREFSERFRGMGEQFKLNGNEPFIVIEPNADEGAGHDNSLRGQLRRLDERLERLEKMLGDLKGRPADEAPAGDGKQPAPKKNKLQGAARDTGLPVVQVRDSRL